MHHIGWVRATANFCGLAFRPCSFYSCPQQVQKCCKTRSERDKNSALGTTLVGHGGWTGWLQLNLLWRMILALFSIPLAAWGQPSAAPALISFAVSSGGADQIVWPQLDTDASFTVQSCPSASCSSPVDVPGTPTLLCASCNQFVLSYTVAGRRRLEGIGAFYRVKWTAAEGQIVYSAATATQEGTGPSSSTSPVYVDVYRGGTSGGCGSWSAPCSQISSGIAACPSGGTVWLSAGTYTGAGNTEVSFGGKAITVSSTLGAANTVIAGNGANRGFIFNSNETFASVLNGVTVAFGSDSGSSGAAILIDSAGPSISNCIFTGGVAQGDGGAICITNTKGINVLDPAQAYKATTQISGTTFINNTALNGGGISVTNAGVTITDSLFEYNFATQSGAGRGGAMVATFSGFLLTNVVMMNGYAVFSGGGLHTEAAITFAPCSGVQMVNNSATSFGGAMTSFAGSALFFTQSDFSDNVSGFYGGGMLALYGNATVTYSKINRNRSTYGGGATKALAGSLFLDNCQIANNTANAGAGTEIAGASGYLTIVGITNSIISGNSAALQGAAFNLGSTNATSFENVTFLDNAATSGGAGYCAGDVDPPSGSLTITDSYFVSNDAQLGGSIYATTGCIASIEATSFISNTARQYGSAIVTTNGVTLDINGSDFTSNGNVPGTVPPSAGGAVSIGYNQFVVGASSEPTQLTNVSINSTTFSYNAATDRGGALNLQSGALSLSNSIFLGNLVTAASTTDVGTGGAISVIDACINGACPPAVAIITQTDLSLNYAFQAGGGLYYSTANAGSGLSYNGGTISGNRVQFSLSERNKYGLGGGIFVSNSSFALQDLAFSNNSAYLGGALFARANFSVGSHLQSLSYGTNNALLGSDQFWLRSSSPSAPLACSGCSHVLTSSLATATEVVHLNYVTPPPPSVQSSQPAPTFVVALQDYYGNQGLAEFSGTCQVIYSGSALTLPELGRVVDIYNGTATFQQFEVQGGIGSSFVLQLSCAPGTTGQNPLLPSNVTITPLSLPLSIGLCPQGTEERGVLCQSCGLNFYNYNSTSCQPCPEGAQCPGGSLGLATPLLTMAGYWRSSNASAALYRCEKTNACQGYPTASGEAYGDAACPPGSVGPLCAVCAPGSFGFGGSCKTCTGSAQGSLMLAFAVLLFLALLVILFVFDFGTDLKPGIMTKLKTLLTHFQLMSLFRTYDVTWPSATQENLSWADTLNVGVSVAAPGCWIPQYNFYVFYLIQMSLPMLLVLLCLGVFIAAVKTSRKLEEYLEEVIFDRQLPEQKAEGWSIWLDNLQTRCYKNAFWFVTLLYPRCAQTSMQMFATQTLDVGTFLKADYSIATRTADGGLSHTYAAYLVLGTILVILFTLVLPLFYILVIWRLRDKLEEESVIKRYGFLYGGYSFPYWEVADMVRKLAIAAIPVFIKTQPTGSLQAVLGEIVLVFYIFVVSYLKPFANPHDNLLQVGSMLVLFLLLLSGESLKWAKLTSTQQQYMSDAQIVLTTGVAVSVVLYALLNLGFVRRGLKAVFWHLMGAANKVAPAGPEEENQSSSSSEGKASLKGKAERSSIWDDTSDFSDGSSYIGASVEDTPREEPVANPLLLAFPGYVTQRAPGLRDTEGLGVLAVGSSSIRPRVLEQVRDGSFKKGIQ